jgi:hypothetical protein
VKIIMVGFAILWLTACGTIGSPIPPEDVGVALTIEQQKRLDAEAAKRETEDSQPAFESLGQDVDLPPLQPVGTR